MYHRGFFSVWSASESDRREEVDGLIRPEMFRSWRDRTGKGRDEAPSWCDGGGG